MSNDLVIVEREGSVGRIRLNRPQAINAVNLSMLRAVTDAVYDLDGDSSIRQIELYGSGDRGFCAGADVRELREMVLAEGDIEGYFATEYRLDLTIAGLSTPFRPFMFGVTMGGGMGMSIHASDRVVDASSRLAMPETLIGLFPDVFATHLFSRMPGEVGTHLALTGSPVNAADAIRLGLADRGVGDLPAPDPVLAGEWIRECYAGDDPGAILERLQNHPNSDARTTADLIAQRSPMAVAVTLEALRRAGRYPTITDQYEQELTLAVRMVTGPDFVEGVRAQLVDRDRSPHWTHQRVNEVTRTEVLSYFEPL